MAFPRVSEWSAVQYNHVNSVVVRLRAYPQESVVPGTANDLQGVIDGYRKLLREKDVAPVVPQPHRIPWGREFLLFAQTGPDRPSHAW